MITVMDKKGIATVVKYYETDVIDWTWMRSLKEIFHLEFIGQNIDACELTKIPPVYELKLKHCIISSLEPIAEITNLCRLEINQSKWQDWSQLAKMKLSSLCLNENNIDDIGFVPLLDKCLNELVLCGNRISDISPLTEMQGLEFLALDCNQISDISSLRAFSHGSQRDYWGFLALGDNCIENIDVLSEDISSRWNTVHIDGNLIRNISHLLQQKADSLPYLHIQQNHISESDKRALIRKYTGTGKESYLKV